MPRVYTQEEKIAFVTAVARRYPSEGRALKAIADELGISASNYYQWLKAGIRPQIDAPKPVTSPPAPYDEAERERLKREVNRLRQSGLGILAACKEVGISDKSYRKWSTAEPAKVAMRPVALTVAVSGVSSLTLVSPGGYRVEGLGVESAAALLRALT
jgi:transposase-like protein